MVDPKLQLLICDACPDKDCDNCPLALAQSVERQTLAVQGMIQAEIIPGIGAATLKGQELLAAVGDLNARLQQYGVPISSH